MTASTSTTATDHAAALRAAATACVGDTVPVADLAAALLGGWPAVADGPAQATAALVNLAEKRDPAALPLVRGLLAAAPAALTQMAAMSRLTSLSRALGGMIPGCDAGDCRGCLEGLDPALGGDDAARLEAWRARTAGWMADLVAERTLGAEDSAALAGLAGLEARCLLARVEQLAGRLDRRDRRPERRWNTVARWRETARDLDRLAACLNAGELDDPRAVRSRLAAEAGSEAMAALVAGSEASPSGQRLARLLKHLSQPSLRVEDPGAALDRMLAVVDLQGDRPLLAADPDPLLLGVIVLERGRGCWLQLDLPGERLANAKRQGFEPPHGVAIVGEALYVACTPAHLEPPQPPNRGRAAALEEEKDESQSAIKQLVLTNLGTTSVLLEFLRDAKIFSIPGLVEEIANRTRNPQVLETIATTRCLHSGFANRNVPLALLRSPVNVSVRTLRRFIHVKYISKMELKRMANDKSGLRKEVHREIEKYLASLA